MVGTGNSSNGQIIMTTGTAYLRKLANRFTIESGRISAIKTQVE